MNTDREVEKILDKAIAKGGPIDFDKTIATLKTNCPNEDEQVLIEKVFDYNRQGEEKIMPKYNIRWFEDEYDYTVYESSGCGYCNGTVYRCWVDKGQSPEEAEAGQCLGCGRMFELT